MVFVIRFFIGFYPHFPVCLFMVFVFCRVFIYGVCSWVLYRVFCTLSCLFIDGVIHTHLLLVSLIPCCLFFDVLMS